MNCMKLFIFVFVGFLSVRRIHGDLISDKRALLDFAAKLPHYRSLNWDENSPICDHWIGITCNDEHSGVIAVRLPAVGFDGPIPPETIERLSELQILSLRSNNINGEFPRNLANLKNLSFLYVQSNNLSGELPADFSVWKNLTVVNLSGNKFNGSIPLSLQNSTNLVSLNLANNSLSGPIPDFRIPGLQQLDFSNNHLAGIVPKFLRSRFPDSAFKGNDNLTLPKLPPPPPPQLPPQTAKSKLGEAALLGIIVAGGILALIATGFLLIICCSRTRRKNGTAMMMMMSSSSLEKGTRKMKMMSSPEKREAGANRLAFFEGGCGQAFDLEDLLRASAEVLGKGTFGTAYKAALEDGTVVVKRLKDVGVGKRDFEQQMEIVGAIRDENVVELRAYYYSKDEKLMLYDFYPDGSLSALLHGRRREDRVPLDWETRLRIAVGAARGIARIHTENNGKLVHGNVKSTNIFVNPSSGSGCVSDAGLAAIMSPLAHPVSRAAGYRAPEVSDTRKAGQPSDVYSFGVVLLELLTGKSPIHTTAGDEMVHLVRWVHSVVREEWTDEVFDVELMRYANIEEETVETLQIALSCVVRRPDQRPRMSDVANMIENVRQPKRLVGPPGQGIK